MHELPDTRMHIEAICTPQHMDRLYLGNIEVPQGPLQALFASSFPHPASQPHQESTEIHQLANYYDREGNLSKYPSTYVSRALPPLLPKEKDLVRSPSPSSPDQASPPRRTQRLSNSERGKLYRSRKKHYVDSLEHYVQRLRVEVDNLQIYEQTKRQLLQLTQSPRETSVARVVCEYFSLFRYGVSTTRENGKQLTKEEAVRCSQQSSFLNTLIDPSLEFGGNCGISQLVKQWERYSFYHSSLQFELQNLEVVYADPQPIVIAPSILHVQISRRTIEMVFPHVLSNEQLVHKLIGLDVRYPVLNTFYFDDHRRICRFEVEVDFLTGFIQALGSIQLALMLVNGARIHSQHMLKKADDKSEIYACESRECS